MVGITKNDGTGYLGKYDTPPHSRPTSRVEPNGCLRKQTKQENPIRENQKSKLREMKPGGFKSHSKIL